MTATRPSPSRLQWKRAKKVNGPCRRQRDWQSRCGTYRVYESKVPGYTTKFYALWLSPAVDGWVSCERDAHGRPKLHTKRSTAIAACERHHRHQTAKVAG